MNKILSLLLLLVFTLKMTAHAGNLPEFEGEITWSSFFEKDNKQSGELFIGQNAESFFFIRLFENKQIIEKYNLNSLKLVASREFELKYLKKKLNLHSALMHADSPAIQTSLYNRKEKIHYSFVHFFDRSTLYLSDPIVISKANQPKPKIKVNNQTVEVGCRPIVQSSNKTYGFNIDDNYSRIIGKRKVDVGKTACLLIDQKMEVFSKNKIQFPTDLMHAKVTLGNNGLLYAAGFEQGENVDIEFLLSGRIVQANEMTINIFDIRSEKHNVAQLSFGDRNIRSYEFRVLNNGSIIVSGVTGKGNGREISGTFYARLDSTLTVEVFNQMDFVEDSILYDIGKNSDSICYYTKELLAKPNGSTILILENYKITNKTSAILINIKTGHRRYLTTQVFHYNDLLVLNFDSAGSLIWTKIIEKNQTFGHDYSSFFTLEFDNKVNFLFNESSALVSVSIDEKGVQTKEKIIQFKDGMHLVPKDCKKIEERKIFLHAQSANGDKYGILEW